MLGTVVQAAGLVDDTVMWQMNTADTHLKTINWIFMWIIAGAGFRGTGRTGLENRSCMDYMPLPILFGQSVCMFPMRQVT